MPNLEMRLKRFFSSDSATIGVPFSQASKSQHLSEMEGQLFSFIEQAISSVEDDLPLTMVFLPVGIPGMGKTTLGRFLAQASARLSLPGS